MKTIIKKQNIVDFAKSKNLHVRVVDPETTHGTRMIGIDVGQSFVWFRSFDNDDYRYNKREAKDSGRISHGVSSFVMDLLKELEIFCYPDPVISDVEKDGSIEGDISFVATLGDGTMHSCCIPYEVTIETKKDMESFNGLNDKTEYSEYIEYNLITNESEMQFVDQELNTFYYPFLNVTRSHIYKHLELYLKSNAVQLMKGI